jgi:hypothetical protein
MRSVENNVTTIGGKAIEADEVATAVEQALTCASMVALPAEKTCWFFEPNPCRNDSKRFAYRPTDSTADDTSPVLGPIAGR